MFATSLSISLLILLSLAGLLEVSLRFLQLLLAFARGDNRQGTIARVTAAPAAFVSVHVPTCNEPPSLVIATLRSLARSQFASFEVIVVDNNTTDSALWKPVAAEIARLGPQFRFIRRARLAGAKAGALNVALGAADPRTTHVAIVDADYQVERGFLSEAVAAAQRPGVDYVQFPQAYRAVGREARGVECELGDYFSCFAVGAGRTGSLLPTGTLSLFSVTALRAVGGWPTRTITEDAEIGVRLQAAGYRGLWLARCLGRGLLPTDLRGIRKQRARWSAGNFQVLRGLRAMRGRTASMRDLVYLISQLTAWISVILPAAIALLVVPLLPRLPMRGPIVLVAADTILLSAFLSACRIIAVGDNRTSLAMRLEAVVTKIALTWTSATGWVPALWPKPLTFHRTTKALAPMPERDPAVLTISLLFLALAGFYAYTTLLLPTLACLLLAAIWPCGRFVDTSLRLAAARNPELS